MQAKTLLPEDYDYETIPEWLAAHLLRKHHCSPVLVSWDCIDTARDVEADGKPYRKFHTFRVDQHAKYNVKELEEFLGYR
jgi:hypothetical protein